MNWECVAGVKIVRHGIGEKHRAQFCRPDRHFLADVSLSRAGTGTTSRRAFSIVIAEDEEQRHILTEQIEIITLCSILRLGVRVWKQGEEQNGCENFSKAHDNILMSLRARRAKQSPVNMVYFSH